MVVGLLLLLGLTVLSPRPRKHIGNNLFSSQQKKLKKPVIEVVEAT
jgi:hypothetical protein